MQMKFNVAKCHCMRVTRHYEYKRILHDYTLHQQTSENLQSPKFLGITLTENMNLGQHISDNSSTATKTLGFLCRNLAFAPRNTKEPPRLHIKLWRIYIKLEYATSLLNY